MTTIEDIPEEILEFILSNISPYRDFPAARLVCSRWYRIVTGLIKKKHADFQESVACRTTEWRKLANVSRPTITERYSHSACYHDKSLYVFGGYASTNTTFNDLWRLVLSTREWVRPLAMGTYPPPKACCSLVSYGDGLVLFGGWSHPTPYPLHQAGRFFNEVHVYTPSTSSWLQVVTPTGPPGTAGHAASVLGHHMVVFGGSQGHGNSTNDIWVLNLKEMTWSRKLSREPVPPPRYGHSQVVLDNRHLLVIGGCRGPNMRYSDVWMLGLDPEQDGARAEWTQMEVLHTEHAVPQIWCHPACQVGKSVVFLSKSTNSANSGGQAAKPTLPASKKQASGAVAEGVPGGSQQAVVCPPSGMAGGSQEACLPSNMVGGSQEPCPPSNSQAAGAEGCTDSRPRAVAPSALGGYDTRPQLLPQERQQLVDSSSDSDDASVNSIVLRRRTAPGVRPNARCDRQRQLAMLKKYEQKIRSRPEPAERIGLPNPGLSQGLGLPNPVLGMPSSSQAVNMANMMQLFVLDISGALGTGRVAWLPVKEHYYQGIPEETILYSLNEGRGELIMFGGIQADLNSMQRGMNVSAQTVTKDTYFIKAKNVII